ncbi:SGNH hydrolase [Actinomycetospora sp. NBRC 106375]|uniref:SGNH/GDSL hydrolase family protein n=1 Tax=Actinomycetospora sp. NBRC 106375 TaxID=3032207 RepID=UPI0024A485C7|nr:SGNH/GDSL hydrolase family protein [Actinomycetospora sp. NBRC 106375]GLZ47779.1 SGNH hydrolase [Actinomycetospora sp. NBRC 106375]
MRYAAIGDSFTEGVGDERGDGAVRGWADLVAAGLAAARGAPISYANFAVRGRLLDDIVTGQLDAALGLDPPPTLLTLNGGGNDMLRPHTDVAELAERTAPVVRRCADAGVRLVLISGADPSDHMPLGRVVRRRGEELTARIAELAAAHDVTYVDCFHDTELHRPIYWSPDRLHLGPAGHRRAAGLILRGILGGGEVPATTGSDLRRGPLAQLRYHREHVLPWVGRRLRGESSGDTATAKHPDWVTVPATRTVAAGFSGA